jgi:hypothetical protein
VWPILLGLLLTGCLLTTAGQLSAVAEAARQRALIGDGFPHCTTVIPTLAAPAAAALFLWLKRQAPTRPVLAGMAAGILSGATAAMAYALTCPVDSLAFVTTWYPVAITICAVGGAIAGSLVLRW